MGNSSFCGCPAPTDITPDIGHVVAEYPDPHAKSREDFDEGTVHKSSQQGAQDGGDSELVIDMPRTDMQAFVDSRDSRAVPEVDAQFVVDAAVSDAKKCWDEEAGARHKQERQAEWEADLITTRRLMLEDPIATHGPANRYGTEADLPPFEVGRHVPLLALLNPLSGAMAGSDILSVCRKQEYYRDRCFNILDVIRGQRRGGMLDVFRLELCRARDEAKALNTRPRLVSGGGDGTGSFVLFIVFLALKADNSREDDGLKDSGNGFIWTDEEMAVSFPALAQMPLGSANDFAHILGWGQKYPGDGHRCCGAHVRAAKVLYRWFEAVIDPSSKVVNFDIWGIMPRKGEQEVDFKIAELVGERGRCPNAHIERKRHIHLREAGKPVPLFVCLYFSAGFGAYMTARFQLNRHKTPLTNRAEYVRQALGIVAESTPSQLQLRLNGVQIDCEGESYFPPRREKGNQGRGYREVGFYNINWQANAMHGASRASCVSRLNCLKHREPVKFNDGLLDMFRWRFTSIIKNPGLRIQTDKKRDMELKYSSAEGQGRGVFFQWDGEARFAFSPTGSDFHIFIRQVLSVPVVLGPYHSKKLTGNVDTGEPARFSFFGDDAEQAEQVRRRVLSAVSNDLDAEVNATREEITTANFRMSTSNDPVIVK